MDNFLYINYNTVFIFTHDWTNMKYERSSISEAMKDNSYKSADFYKISVPDCLLSGLKYVLSIWYKTAWTRNYVLGEYKKSTALSDYLV